MPKISDERRAERRAQIIDAARACFDRQGPQATTMDDIIRESALSAGAVYGYFKSKDELIVAALTTSLSGLRELFQPLLQQQPPPDPDGFVRAITAGILAYSAQEMFDLKRVALQGWAESLRNEPLRTTLRSFYFGYRDLLAGVAADWKRLGMIEASAVPDDVAKTLLALFMGFTAQATILGEVDPATMERGLRAITNPAAKPVRKPNGRRPGAKAASSRASATRS